MLKRNRIIVQLIDEQSDTQSRRYASIGKRKTASSLAPPEIEVEYVNEHSLLLGTKHPELQQAQAQASSKERLLRFDCVGKQAAPHVLAELRQAVEQMLRGESNCCLIEFSAIKQNPLALLDNLLVSEVGRLLQLMQAVVYSIQWLYTCIPNSDVVKPWSSEEMQLKPATSSNLRGRLHNILELHNWLRSEYCALRALGTGHDSLHVQFTYTDRRHRLHKAKFVYYHLYCDKMQQPAQAMLRSFLQNIGNFDVSKRTQPSLITHALQEYFNGLDVWYNCLLFDISLEAHNAVDMLALASEAYKACNNEADANPFDLHTIDSELSTNLSLTKTNQRCKSGSTVNHNRSKTNKIQRKLDDSMNHWHLKINAKYFDAVKAMDCYYECKYRTKVGQLCGNVRNLAHRVDDAIRQFNALPEERHLEDADLRRSYNQYEDSMTAFCNVCSEAKNSKFGEMLKVYVQTRNHELKRKSVNMKLYYLQKSRNCLVGIIGEQVSALSAKQEHIKNEYKLLNEKCNSDFACR